MSASNSVMPAQCPPRPPLPYHEYLCSQFEKKGAVTQADIDKMALLTIMY